MGRRKDWLKTDGIISFVKRVQVSNFYEQSWGKFTTNLSRVENGKDVHISHFSTLIFGLPIIIKLGKKIENKTRSEN